MSKQRIIGCMKPDGSINTFSDASPKDPESLNILKKDFPDCIFVEYEFDKMNDHVWDHIILALIHKKLMEVIKKDNERVEVGVREMDRIVNKGVKGVNETPEQKIDRWANDMRKTGRYSEADISGMRVYQHQRLMDEANKSRVDINYPIMGTTFEQTPFDGVTRIEEQTPEEIIQARIKPMVAEFKYTGSELIFIQQIINLVQEYRYEQKWLPFPANKPEKSGYYLATLKINESCEVEKLYYNANKLGASPENELGFMNNKIIDDVPWLIGCITAYMPLPIQYKP